MDWIAGLLAGTSPLWCQFLAHRYPHWTESEGISSVALYGYLILALSLYTGKTVSDDAHERSFREYCTERAPHVYMCDYRDMAYRGPQPANEGIGARYGN